MRIRVGVVLLGLGVGLAAARAANGDPINTGFVYVQGRTANPDTALQRAENTGLFGASTSLSIGGGAHSATGTASVDRGNLSLTLRASGSSSIGLATIEASAQWIDRMRLLSNAVSAANRVIYDAAPLVVTYELTGQTTSSGLSPQGGAWSSLLGAIGASAVTRTGLIAAGRTTDIGVESSVEVMWSEDGYGWRASFGASVIAFDGVTTADFGNTMRLVSILFADGTRPEDLGYVLEFDSGMRSPNLPSVPEPATLALFGLGAGALALRRRRRKFA